MATASTTGVKESAKYIADHAAHVKLAPAEVFAECAAQFASLYKEGHFSLASWRTHNELNPQVADEDALNWIFVVDTLNFSFFSDDSSANKLFTASYKGVDHSGYWSLCAVINRALDEGVPITSAAYLRDLTMDQLAHIFRSTNGTTAPLLDRRLENLREAGRVLCDEFEGAFSNVVRAAQGSAVRLVQIMADRFSSYNDVAVYNSRPVNILKRAQILVADVWACFEGASYGRFHDIDEITMFADYRVPQILAGLNLMVYSDELMQTLTSNPGLSPGSPLEVEIRGCSIHCVEVLKEHTLRALGGAVAPDQTPLNAIVLDFYLWGEAKRRGAALAHVPIHKTRTIFY